MVGKRLKDARAKKGWTQRELSEISEVSFEQISRYETGKSSPHDYITTKLAKVLEVSPDYLNGIKDDEPSSSSQNEFTVNDHDLSILLDRIKTTTLSPKEKILLKGFLDLLFIRKDGEQLFSKKEF